MLKSILMVCTALTLVQTASTARLGGDTRIDSMDEVSFTAPKDRARKAGR